MTNKHTSEIHGWFNYSKTYDFLLSTIKDDGIFVECGAWLGKSSSYLCDKASDKTKIYIVDSWEGSTNEIDTTHSLVKYQNVYELFLNNMGNRKFIPVKKLSHIAVEDFENNSCDVVFIDMNHTYDEVKQDIKLWLPKVKKNGYLAGHDYTHGWPGVMRAVNELFDYNKLMFMDTCWIYKNEQ